MANKTLGILGIFMVLAGSGWGAGSGRQTAAKESPGAADREDLLRTAPIITIAKQESTGRTNAWIVYLNDGQIANRAIFKYVNRRRPKNLPTSYRYELAAYELNKLLGLELVPATVERTIEGRPGSLQCYCEGVISEASRRRKKLAPPDVAGLQNSFSELGLFENLTNTPRDDASDILLNTGDWKVWRVDFSEAFAPDAALLPDSPFPRCSRRLFQRLREITDSEFSARLTAFLNEEEIRTLLARKRLILDKLESLIREKGEAAVLFEP